MLEFVPFQLGKPAEMGNRKTNKQTKKTKNCKLHLKTEKPFRYLSYFCTADGHGDLHSSGLDQSTLVTSLSLKLTSRETQIQPYALRSYSQTGKALTNNHRYKIEEKSLLGFAVGHHTHDANY